MNRHFSLYLALLILTALFTACLPTPVPPPSPPTALPAGTLLLSDQPRQQQPALPPGDLSQAAADQRAFALDLYHRLSQDNPGNLFLSPYSISQALSMASAGAAGDTLHEMQAALRSSLPPERLHPALNALDQSLAARALELPSNLESGQGFQLSVANALWGQSGYPFQPAFLDQLAQNYGAGLRLLDFSANPQQARDTINRWVEDQTQNRIRDLLPPDGVDPHTRMILTNAIYFKGSWRDPFLPENTQDAPFYRLDGSQANVPLMHKTDELAYASGPDWQAVELPYVSPSFSMVILLPAEGRFSSVEASLEVSTLDAALAALSSRQVELSLPRFEFESSFQLKPALSALGMSAPFDPTRADFSAMADTKELFISDVVHKSFVSVDETGTEAAAATAVIMEAGAAPMEEPPAVMRIDRPFLFLIRERSTGTLLFLGRVTEL